MTEDAAAAGENTATMARLEDQIDWYDRKSQAAQSNFKRLKVLQLVAAAVVPVVAAADATPWITAAVGGVVLVLEGLQQLNQYQQTWITYRSTCEALKHEKFIYLARAGSYTGSPDPTRLLAEKIEGLVSQEHAKWVSDREGTGKADRASR
jgi:hypothetical protein